MRATAIILLMLLPVLTIGKRPIGNALHQHSYEKVMLFGGNLLIDVPTGFAKDREYRHYWDQCEGGGFTVAFKGPHDNDGSMNIQVNIHDRIQDPEHALKNYDPRKQILPHSQMLQDTAYYINGEQHHIIASVHKAANKTNYTYSKYVVASGHMLEYHYYYWHKTGAQLSYWQSVAEQVGNSINWRSSAWVKK